MASGRGGNPGRAFLHLRRQRRRRIESDNAASDDVNISVTVTARREAGDGAFIKVQHCMSLIW